MKSVTWTTVFLSALGSFALAAEQPPTSTGNQRIWLLNHLQADMQALGTFRGAQLHEVEMMIKHGLTGKAAPLLTDYYYLTRQKAENDIQLFLQAQIAQAQLYQAQLNQAQLNQGQVRPGLATPVQPPPVQAPQATAEQEKNSAEREKLLNLGKRLAAMHKPVPALSEYIYASVPGWSARTLGAVPLSYYTQGRYVGPLASDQYAGPYSVAIYNAYADQSSPFNKLILVFRNTWTSPGTLSPVSATIRMNVPAGGMPPTSVTIKTTFPPRTATPMPARGTPVSPYATNQTNRQNKR